MGRQFSCLYLDVIGVGDGKGHLLKVGAIRWCYRQSQTWGEEGLRLTLHDELQPHCIYNPNYPEKKQIHLRSVSSRYLRGQGWTPAHAANKLLLEPFSEVWQQLGRSVQQAADDLYRGVSQGQAYIWARQKILQLWQQLIHLTGVEVGHISGQAEQHVGLAVSWNQQHLNQTLAKLL